MDQIYRKVGRRYKPIIWTCTCKPDVWPHGVHVIKVDRYSRQIRYNIRPCNFSLLAAAMLKKDEICRILTDYLSMQPERKPTTKRQRKCWEDFKKAMGDDQFLIRYPSIVEICETIIDELVK